MHDQIKLTVDEAVGRLSKQVAEADALRDEHDRDNITWGMYIYQMRAWQFALPQSQTLAYLLPALQGEVGELSQIFAKIERDKGGCILDDDIERIKSEIGDVLWMLAGLTSLYNLDLGEIAWGNVQKLTDRQRRGKINGSGDDR
jgi:NTP pyrophosphatase (non-canonical NTP hydrolase)